MQSPKVSIKWKASDYKYPFHHWTPPQLVYPCRPSEKNALHVLKNLFGPLESYKELETKAVSQNTLVSLDTPLSDGHIAFLENTAEQCTSPQTKHSSEGMQGARHWVQRVDTPDKMFQRLTDGYGVSLMFGERCHQYIRNSNNWRGISGVQLDLDVWYQQPDALKKKLEAEDRDADFIAERLDANEKLPLPVYSQSELFERYPLIPRICTFILPTAKSLYDGRPFNTRGTVLFPEPVTDMRIYRAFGDMLCSELDCIPSNVTKNPVAVGFGNTHNAAEAYRNDQIDTAWISDRLQECAVNVISETQRSEKKKKEKTERKAHSASQSFNGTSEGENISAFIEQCDPVAGMVKDGLLTPEKGNDYRWHQSENARSCDILDGVIHIFSHTMSAASPAAELEPVGTHRFYLYQLCGLDMTQDADKPRIREYLFEHGYGSDPKAYISKRNHKPVKLHKKTDLECVIEPIEKAREALQSCFKSKKKLIGFRADTGIGKTFLGIQLYQIKGIGGFISTPTTDLAKEVETRLYTAEIGVYRWRGIHSEPDGQFPHEKACMFPDEYKAYAESGRNAYKMLCEHCPYLTECNDDGYRSQEAKAKAAQVVVAAHKDLLFNPLFRNTANLLLPKYKDDMILIDEFDVFESFIKIEITQARLEYLKKTWHNHPLGEFATLLLKACILEDDTYTSIRNTLDVIEGEIRSDIIEALTSYRIGDKIYDRKAAHELSEDIGQSTEYIQSLPKIETKTWNLLTHLDVFFSQYRHSQSAPLQWEKNTLTLYLPPLPRYTRSKVVCMSATLNQTFFEKAFESRQEKRNDVGFIDADDTEWHPDARVYQLRTNRNPRGTLLTAEKIKGTDGKERWHYTGFSATGQKEFDDTLAFVKANPQRPHALISYKWVIETYADELQEAGMITGHFGGLVGLDTHFRRDTDTPIFLHILGAPEVPPYETEHRYQLLYGDRETPPNFTRNDTTGEYHDKDVQAIYEAGVKSELMQAIGRAGLVKNPSTVILRTSHDLPSVSHRDQTIHWDHVDSAAADNNLDTLREVVAQREAREAVEAEAIANGDVKAIMEIKDVGKSQAYKDTKDTRPQRVANKKADRDAQVIGLHQQGGSLREIETSTGIPRSTVSRIIKGGDHEVSQSSTPLLDSTYRAVEEWDTRGHPDVQCPDSETLHAQEPSVDPQKADRDAKVIALWDNGNGLNASEIERETGVPRATVNRILKPLKTGDQNDQSSHSTINSTNSTLGKMVTPTNPDDTRIECKIMDASEPESHHGTFFKLIEISTCFYEKKQISASDISQLTGIDESEVRRILDNWYKAVVISPGIGDQYWMTERDKKNLWDKILGPAFTQWTENFPGQKVSYPSITFEWIGPGPNPGDDLEVLPYNRAK